MGLAMPYGRYAVLIKRTAFVISWGKSRDGLGHALRQIRCILKAGDFVMYIENVPGTEMMNIKLNVERKISRRKNKKYVVTTIDIRA